MKINRCALEQQFDPWQDAQMSHSHPSRSTESAQKIAVA